MFGAALIVAPWPTLLALAALYLLMIPVAFASYARVKRRRASARVDAHRLLRTRTRIRTPRPAQRSRWLHRLALEGSGDLRAAFLKNRCTHDHEQPQGGEEGRGYQEAAVITFILL